LGHTPQPVVGTQHPVAEFATSKQQHLGSQLLALKQRQDRNPSGGRVQLDQGKVDRGRGRHRQAARVDDDAADLRLAAGNPDAVVAGEVGGGVRCGQHPALVDERAGAVAVEEGDDRRPVGLVDQAVRVGAVVSKQQPSPRSPPDKSHTTIGGTADAPR
jgi:hypothetical protein